MEMASSRGLRTTLPARWQYAYWCRRVVVEHCEPAASSWHGLRIRCGVD
jgi:hypothetical protein